MSAVVAAAGETEEQKRAMSKLSLFMPRVVHPTVRIGSHPRKQVLCLIPLAAGTVLAVVMKLDADKIAFFTIGFAFFLFFLYSAWIRLLVDQDRLLIRSPLWKVIGLDRLVEFKAVSGKNGPLLYLKDDQGNCSWVALERLGHGGRRKLCRALQAYVDQEQTRLVGPVRVMLAQYAAE